MIIYTSFSIGELGDDCCESICFGFGSRLPETGFPLTQATEARFECSQSYFGICNTCTHSTSPKREFSSSKKRIFFYQWITIIVGLSMQGVSQRRKKYNLLNYEWNELFRYVIHGWGTFPVNGRTPFKRWARSYSSQLKQMEHSSRFSLKGSLKKLYTADNLPWLAYPEIHSS